MVQSPTAKAAPLTPPTSGVAAGRGAIYITLAKLWFMLSGYGLAFTLPRLFTPEDYGIYKVVTNAVSIINAVIVTGTYQTVSKYISQEPNKAGTVKARALRLQVVVGGAAAGGFFALAPLVARLLNDARLTGYLRLASVITLAYSFYAVYTGYFNGQRKFKVQAAVDATYSTLKLVFIITLAWVGYGVMGGVGGFALAAVCVLAVSALIGRGGGRVGDVRAGELLRFQSYLLLFTLLFTVLQKVDLMLIKALSSADRTIASENAGYYGAAVDVANLTYQIIISVTFVIFPLVSQSTFEDDKRRTQGYISNTLRYSLMIMALTATLFSANASGVLRVIYREQYQAGAGALGIIAFGMLFLGLLYVLSTIISAAGRPAVSVLIAAVTLAVSAALNALLIPRYGLVGAAAATTVAMVIGTAAALGYVVARFGAVMSPASILRIAVCAGAVYVASRYLVPSSRLMVIAQLAAMGIAYCVLLIVSREVGANDLKMIARVLGR